MLKIKNTIKDDDKLSQNIKKLFQTLYNDFWVNIKIYRHVNFYPKWV